MTAKFYRIVVLLTIAFIAIVLSGCSSTMNVAVNAAPDNGASHQSVASSSRISDCGLTSKQVILNAIDADLKDASEAAGKPVSKLDISTDDWLDGQMPAHQCIAARPEQQ